MAAIALLLEDGTGFLLEDGATGLLLDGAPVGVGGGYWAPRAWAKGYWAPRYWAPGIAVTPPSAHAAVGDLRAVVGLTAVTTGPSAGVVTGGRAVVTLPMRWSVEGELGVVVGLTARAAFQRGQPPRAIVPRRHAAPAQLALRAGLTGRAEFVDVLELDDEDVLVLLGGRS